MMPGFLMLLLVGANAVAAPPLSGFPFTDESLSYTVKSPGGIGLGETHLVAKQGPAGWAFTMNATAGFPGFAIKDVYTAHTNSDFCSTDFTRQWEHGSHKGREEESVDRSQESVSRTTIGGGGGKSEFPITDCVKDALTLVYYTRRELGQGRVPPAQQFLFGGLYDIHMNWAGPQTITSGKEPAVTDKVVCTVKGPASTFSFEMYLARDPARTPLLVAVPLPIGRLTMELVR